VIEAATSVGADHNQVGPPRPGLCGNLFGNSTAYLFNSKQRPCRQYSGNRRNGGGLFKDLLSGFDQGAFEIVDIDK
jgi:hypothetical protein